MTARTEHLLAIAQRRREQLETELADCLPGRRQEQIERELAELEEVQ